MADLSSVTPYLSSSRRPAKYAKPGRPVHSTISKDRTGGEGGRRASSPTHLGRRQQLTTQQSALPVVSHDTSLQHDSVDDTSTYDNATNDEAHERSRVDDHFLFAASYMDKSRRAIPMEWTQDNAQDADSDQESSSHHIFESPPPPKHTGRRILRKDPIPQVMLRDQQRSQASSSGVARASERKPFQAGTPYFHRR